MHTVTSVFPSVTGPAYTPFLMGRYPGPVGLPGLRWYDRARTRCTFPDYARSYCGHETRHLDGDLDADAPTMFELTDTKVGAVSTIARGLSRPEQIGRGFPFVLRAARVHFSGDVRGWLGIDRDIGRVVARHVRVHRPDFTFAALMGIDRTSHQSGHRSPALDEALHLIDDTAAELRHDAERDGRWERTHLWVVSDHGHCPVRTHDELAALVRAAGYRTIAHPWVYTRRPEVAVMVSGNAMAHLYVELERRERPWWPTLSARWESLVELLLERPSIDLVLLPHSPSRCEVRARGRGSALVERVAGCFSYRPVTGDPLGLGEGGMWTEQESYELAIQSDYPDALVQIISLAGSPRAGDIILSAAREWDFRRRYEPIPHVSSHGAIHRDHMLVPLLVNHPVAGTPRRTVDVMPSALRALGLPLPSGLDGEAFI